MNLAELYRRGDDDFDSLGELEKSLYCLLDFQILCEMEGFTHYFATDRNRHIPHILALLEAIASPNVSPVREMVEFIRGRVASWDAEAVEHLLSDLGADDESRVDAWGEQYESSVDDVWVKIREYLLTHHGIEVEDA